MLEFSSIFYNDFFQIWEIKMPSNLTALQIQLEILRLIQKLVLLLQKKSYKNLLILAFNVIFVQSNAS
ncbi:hypothetical protein CGSHiGG_01380 [Haemophilus influenzae PittGG]|uniref:Uncharacterized protein n=1 Tax=Haemophilus influenzae (strain PittGG) TaxID=374931 RepID=A5UF04_HAEIG|nr:hypothetical protein CGSHiGG_01380 [Haemophilus influenzae PittGG]